MNAQESTLSAAISADVTAYPEDGGEARGEFAKVLLAVGGASFSTSCDSIGGGIETSIVMREATLYAEEAPMLDDIWDLRQAL